VRALYVVFVASCGFHPAAATGDGGRSDAPGTTLDGLATLDAPGSAAPGGFDPSVCPSTYVAYAGASPTSRYRIHAQGTIQPWAIAEGLCEADHNSVTTPHLVVFDTEAERAAIVADVAATIQDNYVWTGDYTRGPNEPYLSITGGAMTDTTGWQGGSAVFNANGVPFDGPNGAALEALDQPPAVYVSTPFNFFYNFICECDGATLVEP
jgi:hypothetical protein